MTSKRPGSIWNTRNKIQENHTCEKKYIRQLHPSFVRRKIRWNTPLIHTHLTRIKNLSTNSSPHRTIWHFFLGSSIQFIIFHVVCSYRQSLLARRHYYFRIPDGESRGPPFLLIHQNFLLLCGFFFHVQIRKKKISA